MSASKITYAVSWLHDHRKAVNAWVIRAVSFYFGYRILNHEIYGKATAEPLLIFLGLWLCGIAPASFFDGVRKMGGAASTAPKEPDAPPAIPEPKSEDKGSA